jgi:hypothetical protein
MRALVLLCTLLVVGAGCGSAPPSADWQQQARAAHEAGDADTYLRLTRQAAHAGDLDALAVMAEAASRGYVRVGRVPDTWTNVPVRVWPGEAARWSRRFLARLDAGVAAGEPDARFQHAMLRLGNHTMAHVLRHERPWSPADSAKGATDLAALAADGHLGAMRLHALRLGFARSPEAGRWFDRLDAAGDTTSCLLRIAVLTRPAYASAQGLAAYTDAAMACHGGPAEVNERLATVARRAREGNAPARALADSLVALGVYDRHPSLTAPG